MTDRIGTVYVKNKMSCHGRSDRVWSMMKTRKNNDVINRIDLVYVENSTELLRLI